MRIFKYMVAAIVVATLSLSSAMAGEAAGQSKSGSKASDTYRIMTCNIRITGLKDDAPYPERVWENRRDFCVETIRDRKPDVFCLQEVIYDSYEFFKEKFKDYYAFGFEGPEMDPYTEGYHYIGKNVIFFRKSRFSLVGSGVYWLSDEPLKGGSMSWGTTRARHCNWVRIKDNKTGKQMRVLAVHLDHKSDNARREQIKMILDEASQYSVDMPQIMCGDFNTGIESLPVQYIREEGSWKEMWEAVNGEVECGFTYHAFEGEKYVPKKKNRRIDFLFYRGNSIEVEDCLVLKDSKEFKGSIDGKPYTAAMYPSDHFFVLADFTL